MYQSDHGIYLGLYHDTKGGIYQGIYRQIYHDIYPGIDHSIYHGMKDGIYHDSHGRYQDIWLIMAMVYIMIYTIFLFCIYHGIYLRWYIPLLGWYIP